jgi:hypothetical protein
MAYLPTLVLCALALLTPRPARALDDPQPFVQVRALAELGFLGAVDHTIQYGKDGSSFDYVGEGAQNTVFLFTRLTAELELGGRHTIILLYQPLDFRTAVRLRRDILVDELTFPADTALDLRYGFDFYRLSYMYDLYGRLARHELSLGASLQIRNATVSFTSADGKLRRAFTNIGPVPTLKARGRYTFDCDVWIESELDFMYAPVKYINGGASDVEGAIFDLNLRAGLPVFTGGAVFLNLRYLGGGASGTSPDENTVGDGYVSNWLHFMTLSLGGELSLTELFN